MSLLGVVVGFLVLAYPFLSGRTGGGDVKLMMGIGAWFGVRSTLYVFIFSSFATGLYALTAVIIRRCLGKSFQPPTPAPVPVEADGEEHLTLLIEQKDRWLRVIPHGAMIAVGVLIEPLLTNWNP
jgi:hypothetical protein